MTKEQHEARIDKIARSKIAAGMPRDVAFREVLVQEVAELKATLDLALGNDEEGAGDVEG